MRLDRSSDGGMRLSDQSIGLLGVVDARAVQAHLVVQIRLAVGEFAHALEVPDLVRIQDLELALDHRDLRTKGLDVEVADLLVVRVVQALELLFPLRDPIF